MSLILIPFSWVAMITAVRDGAIVNIGYLTTHLLCACQVKLPALKGWAS
ncbi:MAG: hypothetical protein PVJ69_13910 [Desulfobacteraceae bacterium]|jgi:hypothetical protein